MPRAHSYPLRARSPYAGSALVTASCSIEKAVPEEHTGPTANCASGRVAKVGAEQRIGDLPRRGNLRFLRLIPIRAARLMRHHARPFPIPGLSHCMEAPAAIGRLILPASASERSAP